MASDRYLTGDPKDPKRINALVALRLAGFHYGFVPGESGAPLQVVSENDGHAYLRKGPQADVLAEGLEAIEQMAMEREKRLVRNKELGILELPHEGFLSERDRLNSLVTSIVREFYREVESHG